MLRVAALTIVLTFTAPAVSAKEFEGGVQPPDVFVAVTTLAADLETVRAYVGGPQVVLNRFRVKFAAPRHVFYQAQTLFRKINRLGTDIGGLTRQSPPPAPEASEIVPADVLRVVRLAHEQLALVRETLGIDQTAPEPARDPRMQPKDVFEAIVQANRQVNLMLSEPFRPSDVHDQLSLTSVYVGGVLAAAGEEPFPNVSFVPNKQPIDVYDRLIDCLVANQQVGERLELPVLQIDPGRLKRDRTSLSDNYDIATMLLSDVAFWSARMDTDDVFPPPETLRHVFPSHVYVKASTVQEQIQRVLDRI